MACPVVISGISGRFPESSDCDEFKRNLYNGVDMISNDNRRWPPGFNPEELRGTRTGVYIGLMTTEANDFAEGNPEKLTGYETIGSTRAMLANRLSYAFNFSANGYVRSEAAVVIFITRDSSSRRIYCHIVQKAFLLISANGYVRSEAAVVIFITRDSSSRRIYCHIMGTATNTDGHKKQGQTYPSSVRQAELMREVYERCGVDPADVGYVEAHGTGTSVSDNQESVLGITMNRSNGYVRSEAAVVIFITRDSSSRRIYCHIMGTATNTDGHKKQGQTYPSSVRQAELMREVYERCGVDPADVGYVEAHGTGTSVGDVQETNAITEIFCQNRSSPLLIGSVKSNCGHTEPTSGLVSIAKATFTFETGLLPPNINYRTPNPNISGLMEGKLKVVNRVQPLVGDYIAINSFGVGGTNAHVLLKKYAPRPSSGISSTVVSKIPRLMIAAGRTKQCVEQLLDQIGLVNVLKTLGVEPDGIVGHSIGELSCSYADGGFTLEETILAAYYRGCVLVEAKPVRGAMVAVGMGWDEINRKLPNGIVAACHNSNESVTISGPREEVRRFAEELKEGGVFAKEVDSLGFAFHSPYLATAAKLLRTKYEKFLCPADSASPRTPRWISTSFPESEWSDQQAHTCSMDYHLHNVSSPVLFHQAMSYVP
ncbi:fatty acid synthase-like, partial [Diaphorina citri]|uniref:Fatty acid synthase n=1 Tax=Diaphorina citri TaxID=121845 RepID=A0A1S3DN88_DIACI